MQSLARLQRTLSLKQDSRHRMESLVYRIHTITQHLEQFRGALRVLQCRPDKLAPKSHLRHPRFLKRTWQDNQYHSLEILRKRTPDRRTVALHRYADHSQACPRTATPRAQWKRVRATQVHLVVLRRQRPLEMRRILSRRRLRRSSKAMQGNAPQVPYAVRKERMLLVQLRLNNLMSWEEAEQLVAMKGRLGSDARAHPTSTILSSNNNNSNSKPRHLLKRRASPGAYQERHHFQLATNRMSAPPGRYLISWTCRTLPIPL